MHWDPDPSSVAGSYVLLGTPVSPGKKRQEVYPWEPCSVRGSVHTIVPAAP